MTNYPSESSLVVNATQQQLSQSPFTAGVAIAPSQREEAEGGYDIAFDTASRLELQYKAVYSEIDDRTFRRGHTVSAVKFPFDGAQAKTLLGRQTGPGTAFYALPVVTDVSGLGNVLGTTVFLDIVGLWNLPKPPSDFGSTRRSGYPSTMARRHSPKCISKTVRCHDTPNPERMTVLMGSISTPGQNSNG